MNFATAPLLENRYRVLSSELETLGLKKGDWVEFLPLPTYFPGDIVLIVDADGSRKIGKLLSEQSLKVFTPTASPQVQDVLPAAVVGIVVTVNDDDDDLGITQTCSAPAGMSPPL